MREWNRIHVDLLFVSLLGMEEIHKLVLFMYASQRQHDLVIVGLLFDDME